MQLKHRAFLVILMFAIVLPLAAYAQTVIREIRIQGAERVEPATIESYLDLKVGDPMTRETLDAGLKSLFATGLFADVTLTQQGSALVVDVLENPVINQIAFEGNEKLEDDALMAEIQMRPRQVFTRTRVQSDVARLYQVYRRNGRFSVLIEPKVIKLDQNRVDLVFEVTEGDVTKVESIRFVGNKRFDDDRLRSEISTKEAAWYRFLTSDDRYDPDRLAYDEELLRRFYLAHGYADFRILSAVSELSDERDRFFLTFTVEEGERYRVGEVSINSHLSNFDASVLRPEINIESGEWYNADYVRESIDNLTNALGDRQYAFVNVHPDVNRNREERIVDLVFNIDETPRVFVERIDVNGNVRTLDKVVRREFELVEGDPFNKSKLAKSEQNIRNLDFFETVELNAKSGSAPDKTVVEVDVTEKSTGELSVGAGFSTQDGPLADFRIRERNLLGKGQDLALSTVLAGKRSEFDLSFTEPYFLDRDVSAGFDLFHITRDYQDESSYDQRRTGGGLHMGYPLSERWRQALRYRIERNEITDVQSDASRFIREQEGTRDTSALSQRLSYDSRDSVIFPTEGMYYWLDTEVAGLGGDAKYVSGRTGASYYYPLFEHVVLNAMAEAGIIEGYGDENVQINERFYLGGNTLRGFEKAGVGPRDLTSGDSLGGQVFYRGTLESSFPIGLPEELGILGHAFGDVGTLTEVDDNGPEIQDEASLRSSLGLGLSWRSPFGPVRADYAVPVSKEDYDEEEHFRFSFGTRF
ncbi:MAG: outer membrane protein assembly factor BamA [Rhodospirillales bacterium]|nr:outer membrane protein assembly factor BamA [Rhodospirillales bacterium]